MKSDETCIKNIYKLSINTLLVSFLLVLFHSCTVDQELLLDAVLDDDDTEQVDDEGEDTDNGDTSSVDPIDETPVGDFGEVNQTPCDFSLASASANSTIDIDCRMDLQGATINLPSNVQLNFTGGEIVNGTLNFSGGKIDGKLLNSNLNVDGNASLIDTEFLFYPERWDVVQGQTDINQALENRDALNRIIDLIKELDGQTFAIDRFNAFFYGDFFTTDPKNSFESNSIKIPSNFHFKMSSNTFLRIFPSNNPAPRLMGIFKGENIIVSGGNLIGDRYTHDYSPVKDWLGVDRNQHENGTVLFIAGGNNIRIDGVTIEDGTGDAIGIGGSTIRNPDGTLRTNEVIATDVLVINCALKNCRRNNLSVIDGDGVTIENNLISGAGGGTDSSPGYNSNGVDPQFGIDLEAYRERDANNNLIEYERVENVIIRGNNFTNNFKGDLVIFTANDVLVENNTMDNFVGANAAFNCTIRNNTIVARESGVQTSIGISFGELIINGEDLVYNNEITGNTISGFDTGISIGGLDMSVNNNTIRDFDEGIFFKRLRNSEVFNNDMQSFRNISWGYITVNGNVRNVNVSKDVIDVSHKTINFLGLNREFTDGSITFDDVDFVSRGNRSLYLENSSNITISNSRITFGVEEVNTSDIVLINNEVQ
ncbi:MAG: right-handed parallel beta-helix repeat-containing protein [Bacteroidota bacterium]